jgi:Ca-activated chloride channel homolog
MIEFANPIWLWAYLMIPLIIGVYVYRFIRKKRPSLLFSDTMPFNNLPGNGKQYLHWVEQLFFILGLACLIYALARPQEQLTTVERNAEGIDIVLALDISSSMKAEDLKPNRFEAAREVAKEFIDQRISDRIGLVSFAMQSFTVCPPTLDYRLLKELINEVEMGVIQDGTAIGMGIATSVNRLKDSEAKSKVIILLTDGQNNAGEIDPVTAADLALAYDIKIYTIGAGTRGTAPYPVDDPIFGRRYRNIQVDIDEDMLERVAELTGGKYYRATDSQELLRIYQEIDALERTKVEEITYTDYTDLYPVYLALGLLFMASHFLLRQLVLRSIVEV